MGSPSNVEEKITELKEMITTKEGNFGNYVSSLPIVQNAIEYINSVPKYATLYTAIDDNINEIAVGGEGNIATSEPVGFKSGGLMIPRFDGGGIGIENITVKGKKLDAGGRSYGGLGGMSGPRGGSGFSSERLADVRAEQDMEDKIDNIDTNKTMTVQEMFGDVPEEKSLNSLNIDAIKSFKEELPAAIEATSIRPKFSWATIAKKLTEGDEGWFAGGEDSARFKKYEKGMGVNSADDEYYESSSSPAGLGKK